MQHGYLRNLNSLRELLPKFEKQLLFLYCCDDTKSYRSRGNTVSAFK